MRISFICKNVQCSANRYMMEMLPLSLSWPQWSVHSSSFFLDVKNLVEQKIKFEGAFKLRCCISKNKAE